MLITGRRIVAQVSDIRALVQRLERENEALRADLAALRSRIESGEALRSMLAQTTAAALSAPVVGAAMQSFASVMRSPVKRGRPGGLARARQVKGLRERWPSSGRFMAHADWEQIEREVAEDQYMRYAAGGFARVARALRHSDGTFLPDSN